MKGFAMLKIGEVGWIEKDRPQCGPLDAICKPLAVALCTSDVHTVWEGAVGERHNMILGHECCAQVVEVGSEVRDFKPGDRVLIPAITPNWSSLEAQAGYAISTIPIVGVDATSDGRAAIRDGRLNFTVFQDPQAQGAGAVEAAIQMLGGSAPENAVDSAIWIGYTAVDAANVDKLFPDER